MNISNQERKNKIIGLVVEMSCDNYLIEISEKVKETIIDCYNKFSKSLISSNIISKTQSENIDTEWYNLDDYLIVDDLYYTELLSNKRIFEELVDGEGVKYLTFERFFRNEFNENLESI